MTPKNLLPFLLGVATAGPLAVGSSIFAQVGRVDVRENVNAGSLDGFCVYVEKRQVDAGAGGAVTASDFTGAKVEANASLQSFIPDEEPSHCRTTFDLDAAGKTAARQFFQDHVRAKLKTACKMP